MVTVDSKVGIQGSNRAHRASWRRIRSLDGWRGFSILLVVLGHLVNYRYEGQVYRGSHDFFFELLETLSQFGVDIFFVISGFIIVKLSLAV